ncbi:MAG: hypothetical protein NVS3B20_20610 [Polyangiales bacterium]
MSAFAEGNLGSFLSWLMTGVIASERFVVIPLVVPLGSSNGVFVQAKEATEQRRAAGSTFGNGIVALHAGSTGPLM